MGYREVTSGKINIAKKRIKTPFWLEGLALGLVIGSTSMFILFGALPKLLIFVFAAVIFFLIGKKRGCPQESKVIGITQTFDGQRYLRYEDGREERIP